MINLEGLDLLGAEQIRSTAGVGSRSGSPPRGRDCRDGRTCGACGKGSECDDSSLRFVTSGGCARDASGQAAEKRNEFTSFHSITTSSRASSVSGYRKHRSHLILRFQNVL